MLIFILENIILSIVSILPILVSVAYFTVAERKTLAVIQRRTGPNVVGFWGLLQPLADGLKLLLKESLIPTRADKFFYSASPILAMTLSFSSIALIPFGASSIIADLPTGLLLLFALSSLNVYSIVLAGWSSNSKYALLGALRAVAQLISYELAMALSIIPVIMCAGSFNLIDIVVAQKNLSYFFFLFPVAVVFFICIVAETNRAPFDLPEAEAEIVAGYNIEYGGIPFSLFFLAEYCQIIIMSSLWVLLFFGGWWPLVFPFSLLSNVVPPSFIFSFKVVLVCFFFVFIRGNFPRYRYDQLMESGWKVLIPLCVGYLTFVASCLLFFNISIT